MPNIRSKNINNLPAVIQYCFILEIFCEHNPVPEKSISEALQYDEQLRPQLTVPNHDNRCNSVERK